MRKLLNKCLNYVLFSIYDFKETKPQQTEKLKVALESETLILFSNLKSIYDQAYKETSQQKQQEKTTRKKSTFKSGD